MKKDIVIYSFFIAKRLVEEGFKLNNINLNKKHKGKVVFYFEDTTEARKFLLEKYDIVI